MGVTAWVIAFWPDKIKTYLEYRVPVWYVLVAVGVGAVVFVSLQRYRAKRRPVAPPDEKIEMLGLTWEVTGWLQLR